MSIKLCLKNIDLINNKLEKYNGYNTQRQMDDLEKKLNILQLEL